MVAAFFVPTVKTQGIFVNSKQHGEHSYICQVENHDFYYRKVNVLMVRQLLWLLLQLNAHYMIYHVFRCLLYHLQGELCVTGPKLSVFTRLIYCCVAEQKAYHIYIFYNFIYNLTLYIPCIMFQCVDKPTRCNTSYEWSLLSINWLCMFRTVTSPSSRASSHKMCKALVRSCRQV